MLLKFADFEIDATLLSHRVPSYAYRFTEKGLSHQLNHKKLTQEGIPAGIIWGKLQNEQKLYFRIRAYFKS